VRDRIWARRICTHRHLRCDGVDLQGRAHHNIPKVKRANLLRGSRSTTQTAPPHTGQSYTPCHQPSLATHRPAATGVGRCRRPPISIHSQPLHNKHQPYSAVTAHVPSPGSDPYRALEQRIRYSAVTAQVPPTETPASSAAKEPNTNYHCSAPQLFPDAALLHNLGLSTQCVGSSVWPQPIVAIDLSLTRRSVPSCAPSFVRMHTTGLRPAETQTH
jgi:hypothetical protein